MATRLYLPSSGTPPLNSLAVDSSWNRSDNLVRLPCGPNKSNTSLTEKTATWPVNTNSSWVWAQFQTEPLSGGYSWTTSDTISMVIKCAEAAAQADSHLIYSIRVVSGDGSVIRGTIGEFIAVSTEYPTSYAAEATRIHAARPTGATNFNSEDGDRIIIEIGHYGVSPSSDSVWHTYGDPSGTSDYALSQGLTTDLCPWVELSRTVTFGPSTVEESITLTRSELFSASDQISISNDVGFSKFLGLSILEEIHIPLVDESITLGKTLATQKTSQVSIFDTISLLKKLGVSNDLQVSIFDNISLFKKLGFSDNSQVSLSDTISLLKKLSVSNSSQISIFDTLNLLKKLSISNSSQVSIFDGIIIGRVVGQGDNSQLNIIDLINLAKTGGILVGSQVYENEGIILGYSSQLSILEETQGEVSERITLGKLVGINFVTQVSVNEFLNLSRSEEFLTNTNVYSEESIILGNSKGLLIEEIPTFFETIMLSRFNNVNMSSSLMTLDSIDLNRYLSILVEPSAIYIYSRSDHSVGVVFRDKRFGTSFRDKRNNK